MIWSEEKISGLRMLWGEGKSASVIAAELGIASRNAVIGKVHRLKLDGRPSPIKGPIRPRIKKVAQGKTVMGLSDRMCKWPIGDPRQPDFHFCGGNAENGLPYCGEHAALAYQPARKNSSNHDHSRMAASFRD